MATDVPAHGALPCAPTERPSEVLAGLEAMVAAVGPLGLTFIVIAAVLGGVAQSTVGFGGAFATVPALALTAPELLPGAMLVAILPLAVTMAIVGRAQLDRRSATRLMLGRLPGIAIGTVIVLVVDVRWLTAIVAVVLLGAVAAAAGGWHLEVTPRRELVAGMVSGVTGAATALGGPPLALLYRERDPAVVRPTLGVVWAVGIVLTLLGLAAVGSFTGVQALAGILLSALLLVGLLLSRPLLRLLAPAQVRVVILWWAGLGGVAALGRVLAG
ncbi:MAG: sulfite exporter TauE/SafE family protein [Nitriliruptoraceae bacterium]